MSLTEYLARVGPPPSVIAPLLEPLVWEDVARVYYFDDDDARFRDFQLDPDRTDLRWRREGAGAFGWEVDLYALGHTPSITSGGIHRILWRDVPLTEDRSGARVAEHVSFRLHAAFQRCGLATRLHTRECDLYRRWGAREIQLRAAWEGLREGIWLKMGFDFEPGDRAALEESWRSKQESLGIAPAAIRPIPHDFRAWPPELKAWLHNLPDRSVYPMYKRLG